MSYVELESDHQMTAFLAGLTPSKVLRDRELKFTRVERRRHTFLRAKARLERQAAVINWEESA